VRESFRDHCYWNATAPATDFLPLAGEHRVDVAVVGGGIVGITAARALKDRGLTVAVVEARRVGREVTGRSTAKVTALHRLKFQQLEKKIGKKLTQLYADAQVAGLGQIQAYARDLKLDCDLETRPAFTYTLQKARVADIKREVDAAQRYGLAARLVTDTGLPFEVLAAVRLDDQVQFHPTKYVAELARTIPGGGCHVFENSRVIKWYETSVKTDKGRIKARCVIMATHLPFGDIGNLYKRVDPHAEPVIAARSTRVPNGMFICAEEPTHSIRTHTREDGTVYAVATGKHFTLGNIEEERESFADIGGWLGAHFEPGPIEHRWVNEDYMSADLVPFAGWAKAEGKKYLVATGFTAWGLTNGTVAGQMLADLAAGEDSQWLPLYRANRKTPHGGGSFAKKKSGGSGAAGEDKSTLKSFDDLANGQAAVRKIRGKPVAAFKDDDGTLHAVSAACTHMGCNVGWNETDRTWDCPCHGSRFALSGEVIHGPAVEPLAARKV
jgi:glycine/D-amino acid oxidase-like deaminating enzyme/nitrite reductase/ring-hydroxylating ferredoxin subunit